MTAPAADGFCTSDGTRLRVDLTGPAGGQATLVLIHGWTQDRRTWDRVLAELPPGQRVVRYDLRGHGGSAPARQGTATIDQLADDLAELIAARVPSGRLVLAGHSMGGMTIMALAERHPELVSGRVDGVAFVATSSGDMHRITLGLPGVLGGGAARAERRLAELLLAYRKDVLPLRPGAARAGARWLVFGRRARREDVVAVVDQLLCAHPASIGGFQNAISLHDRRVALAALRNTTALVLAGEADRLCPVRHAEAIASELPGARLVLYPGAGHMLPQERAAEVAARLGALVRGAAGSPLRNAEGGTRRRYPATPASR
ncbi:alpha/beta fold hydrolase [Saccharomonospora sp. NPDC046836]|uniref:alpha/beta fold hydrolase n=1 Tax=Saccharomonospora sp. NPDC046836 TaxID=3156921 RepID=UPI003404AE04